MEESKVWVWNIIGSGFGDSGVGFRLGTAPPQ